MKITKILLPVCFLCLGFFITSCQRSSNDVWEDSKSASRHVSRGFKTFMGQNGNSRAIQSRGDFEGSQDISFEEGSVALSGVAVDDFVPLIDQCNDSQVAMADFVSKQPRETPGDIGSSIPGISAFQDPSTNHVWSQVFRNILFDLNSNLVKGQSNLETIRSITNYMKNNPDVYVFVEGHTDERGPEAYNLALGSRRSNAVRNELLQEGVDPDHLFTISYGKERPLFQGHDEESWAQNRRVEFKIYQR